MATSDVSTRSQIHCLVEMETGRYLKTQHKLCLLRYSRSASLKRSMRFCCSMNQPPVDDVATNTTALLVRFEAASPTDVKNVILISAAKSCELDPLLNIATMKAPQCISPHCSIVTRHAGPSLCPWFVLVHTALYEGTPVYLASLLHRHTPRRTLRSGGGLLLNVSSVNLERYGQQAFAGPTLWNSLPLELRANENIKQFKKLLETFCFQINILK